MTDGLTDLKKRRAQRLLWTVLGGYFVGALLTTLTEMFVPDSPPRTVLTTSVVTTINALSIDVAGLAFAIGPVVIPLTLLTLVGMTIVGSAVRAWL